MPSGDAHRSLARALDILELCSLNGSGYTLTQLSQHLGIAKGSISPLLHTLRDRGYLTLDDQDHHYRIGRMAFRIGNTYLDEASALREIYRLMHDIVSVCHETCHLGSLKNGDVYYLKKVETPLRSRTVTVEGRSLPAYATGVGKALLADYQLPQLKALYYDGLYPLTEHTITDFRLLADQLAEIRASALRFISPLIREDFPTLDFPAKAISGRWFSGSGLVIPQTVSRFTFLMIMTFSPFLPS